MHTLQTTDLTKSYRGRKVVDNVSVWVKQGEVVGLLGPNGAGKTTSFYMIVGLITPDSGRVALDDQDITSLAMYQRGGFQIVEPYSADPTPGAIYLKMTL